MRSIWKKERAKGALRKFSLGIIATSLFAGCSTLQVESLPAPDANLAGRTTFRIVERPVPVDADMRVFPAKVMLNNTIIDQMIRDDIRQAFESRGYVMTDTDPDFEVTYYAKAIERLEIDDVDYNYRYYRYGDRLYVDEFTEGTVVIDVLEPSTERLLWRGSGVARVSDDPQKYARQLSKAVDEIIEEYPSAIHRGYIEPRREPEPIGEGI